VNKAHDFQPGETIYDVDGNAYVVVNNRATLTRGNYRISYYLGRSMAGVFTRERRAA
jgi:hypothetical protein